jgi:hypothetical protein
MSLHRITAYAALTLVLASVAAPSAVGQQDLRNPDTRDAADVLSTDLGSPLSTDLRNPDTREVADDGGATPKVTVVEVPVASPSAEAGLDWGDAGIGAGAMLGLTLLAVAGALTVMHRRSAGGGPATAG